MCVKKPFRDPCGCTKLLYKLVDVYFFKIVRRGSLWSYILLECWLIIGSVVADVGFRCCLYWKLCQIAGWFVGVSLVSSSVLFFLLGELIVVARASWAFGDVGWWRNQSGPVVCGRLMQVSWKVVWDVWTLRVYFYSSATFFGFFQFWQVRVYKHP
jgi:hypothetical protein